MSHLGEKEGGRERGKGESEGGEGVRKGIIREKRGEGKEGGREGERERGGGGNVSATCQNLCIVSNTQYTRSKPQTCTSTFTTHAYTCTCKLKPLAS